MMEKYSLLLCRCTPQSSSSCLLSRWTVTLWHSWRPFVPANRGNVSLTKFIKLKYKYKIILNVGSQESTLCECCYNKEFHVTEYQNASSV